MFKKIFLPFLFLVITPSISFSQPGLPVQNNWITLFNGEDLSDWEGDPEVWRVQDGYISGGLIQTETTFMWYKPRTFADFVLELKVWLIDNYGNAGIQYRSEVIDPETWMVKGYQADIGPGIWGNLYDEHRRDINLAMPSQDCTASLNQNDWNDYVIIADGFTLRHFLNGIECLDYTDRDTLNRSGEGIIAIQVHSPGDFEIRYKDIRIRPLNETSTAISPSFNHPGIGPGRNNEQHKFFFNVLGRQIRGPMRPWSRLFTAANGNGTKIKKSIRQRECRE